MSAYPWHQEQLDTLISGQFQSILLVSAPGQGSDRFARHLIQYLMCATQSACGACQSCRWLAQNTELEAGQQNHPDVIELQPEGAAWAHKIDTIRPVIEQVATTTHQGGRRIIYMPEAERLTQGAANSLLKVLEEPPAGTHFILGSHLPGRLPSTILSRCRQVRLPSAPANHLWLDQWVAPSPRRDKALTISTAPDWVIELSDPDSDLESRVQWREQLTAAFTGDPNIEIMVASAQKIGLLAALDDWYMYSVEQAKQLAMAGHSTALAALCKFQNRLNEERQSVLAQVALNPGVVLRALNDWWVRLGQLASQAKPN